MFKCALLAVKINYLLYYPKVSLTWSHYAGLFKSIYVKVVSSIVASTTHREKNQVLMKTIEHFKKLTVFIITFIFKLIITSRQIWIFFQNVYENTVKKFINL